MYRELLSALTALGAVQALAGLLAVRHFASRASNDLRTQPAVTILKPVCGDEILLAEAIASFCDQDYGTFQLIIGAQRLDDPAVDVAQRVRQQFPDLDIEIVVDSTSHGTNRKISNLINMMPFAKHDVLVFADSDLHVRRDYLRRVVGTLQQSACGLVTTACAAEPGARSAASLLGVSHISHTFMPGALLAAAGGRQDCLGGTMALRRATLARIGGLRALADHVADDNRLGSLIRRLGLSVRIAPTLPVVVVQENRLPALWQHEVRWARTIRTLAPVGFASSILQFPLFWALLGVAASGGAAWAVGNFMAAWAVRALVVRGIDYSLRNQRARPAPKMPIWLLPLRDLLSVVVVAAGFWNDRVVWRGQEMHASPPMTELPLPEALLFANDEGLQV